LLGIVECPFSVLKQIGEAASLMYTGMTYRTMRLKKTKRPRRTALWITLVTKLRRHRRVAASTGSIIVLASFVVNECLRDAAKETLQDAQTSLGIYSSRMDAFSLQDKLGNIADTIKPLTMDQKQERLKQEVDQIEDEKNDALDLLYSLPTTEQPSFAGLEVEIDHGMFSAFFNYASTQPSPDIMSILIQQDPQQWEAVQTLRRTAEQAAQKTIHDSRSAAELWTTVSYCLFIIGWLLGLIGSLAGVEVKVED
jgi:hypothetical protein